jgi:UBX domain-containing protein 1
MAGHDEPANPDPNPSPPQQQVPGGGRTLGGAYVPPPAGAFSSSSTPKPAASKQPAQRGVAGARTLKDLQSSGGGGGHGHGHAHDDDDDDDEDYKDDEEQDFFTGGEKSGLAVRDPKQRQANARDQINSIMKRARQ